MRDNDPTGAFFIGFGSDATSGKYKLVRNSKGTGQYPVDKLVDVLERICNRLEAIEKELG